MRMPDPLETARRWVEEHHEAVAGISDQIFHLGEAGLREYRSCRVLGDFLDAHGFEVEYGIAGMPTAFRATWGSGGPCIGMMCEYDAIPGTSQAVKPVPEPLRPDAGGFPDIHNGIGAASAAAAAAAKAAMERYGLRGTIQVLGTPAEKTCIGKPYLAKDGYLDVLDAVVAWHPRKYTTVEWDTGPGCYQADVYEFFGRSEYGARPWAGVSALDAATLMNVILQFMREHIPREYQATVNELVTVGGQHPTTIPNYAQVWYVYRSPERRGIEHVEALLQRAAEAAVLATGAQYRRRLATSVRPWLPNHTMARVAYRNLERLGPPRFPAEMKRFAQEILRNAGLEEDPEPFDETLTPPESGITAEFAGGADDVNEFCWHAPTVRIYVAYGIRHPVPNWAMAALAGTPVAHTTVRRAAQAVALTALDLLLNPRDLEAARREFEERTAEGALKPLVPREAQPPVDLSFPPHYPKGWRPPADRLAE
ncbi:MAG TPA: hypothetical protein VF282_05410 [Bacillota bacterium]